MDYDAAFQVPVDDATWSPIFVNGQSFADFDRTRQTQRLLATEDSAESNVCKKCIDKKNRWCPSSNYSSGRCCSGTDFSTCPKQGYCSDDFNLTEL